MYPNRGLREGCPSSPPLLNIYHDAVMQDFKRRRELAAEAAGRTPGIEWHYKVDSRLAIEGFRARWPRNGARTGQYSTA